MVTQTITDLVDATFELKSKPIQCSVQVYKKTPLYYLKIACSMKGKAFYIILKRLKVGFQVQVLRKRVKKYKSRDQGLEKKAVAKCRVALHLRCN